MNLGVDVGGTFTDLIASDPERRCTFVGKVLNRGQGPGQDLQNALLSVGTRTDEVRELTHGTTIVTNLLIERTGGRVGMLCSRGFRDVLEIQLSYRANALSLGYQKTPPLVPRELRLEVGGRIDPHGREIEPLDEDEVEEALRALLADGVDTLAVALYNAYANPLHERQIERIAQRIAPRLPRTISMGVDRRIGEYERASTTALNAMAVPTVQRYVDDLSSTVPADIQYMHSAGGLLPAAEARARPIQLAFSGPAAGVLAGRVVARQLGYPNAITMDMGGTSCDVCLIWQGSLRYRNQFDVEWGIPARVQSVEVHTVGAGGGSICWRDKGGALRVGPRSAGAVPGPACYGQGGDIATVTDANLTLGILSPHGLLGGQLQLDQAAATTALESLGRQLQVTAQEAAKGVYSIVNANMAQAIRQITVIKGIDPRSCVLIAFGGAGPQHATAVAEQLGIKTVVIPAHGSVLSAVGLLTADHRITSARTLLLPLERLNSEDVHRAFRELSVDAAMRMGALADDSVTIDRFVGLRYVGQSHEVPITVEGNVTSIASRFEAEHQRLYGTQLGDPIEIVDCWVTHTRARSTPEELWATVPEDNDATNHAATYRDVLLMEGRIPVYNRYSIDSKRTGPCLVEESHSVTIVPQGATVDSRLHHLVVEL